MIARNTRGGKCARPHEEGHSWEGRFPSWLRSAAAAGRRAGKFPRTWSTSGHGVLDGIRQLSGKYRFVDRWGCEDGKLVLECYIDNILGGDVIQRLLAIADALGCSVSFSTRPRLAELTRIEFFPTLGLMSPSHIGRYSMVRLISGQSVGVDDRGLITNSRQPTSPPDPAAVQAVGEWFRMARVRTVRKPGFDAEGVTRIAELALDRPLTLGAVIVAAYRSGIPIGLWGKQCPSDALLGVSPAWCRFQESQAYRVREAKYV